MSDIEKVYTPVERTGVEEMIQELDGHTAKIRDHLKNRPEKELIDMLQKLENHLDLPQDERLENPEKLFKPLLIN